MYETILHCKNCGAEHRLVAEDVVAERDRLRAFAEWVVSIGGPAETGTVGWLTMLPKILERAKEALGDA